MGRRRGFFAELQHQAAIAERDRQRAYAAQVRAREKQQRDLERSLAAAERARVAALRANEREKAQAERESKRLHVLAMEEEAASLNLSLQTSLAEIDGILAATLDVDDHVNLELLRQQPSHPPFESELQRPLPEPPPLPRPSEPRMVQLEPPSGLSGLFKKKQHQELVAREEQAFAQRHAQWRQRMSELPAQDAVRRDAHRAAEQVRLAKLADARTVYDAECAQRVAQVRADNDELDDLIRGYERGEAAAVEEYCGIVFANSVYPDGFSLDLTLAYAPADRELTLQVGVPSPDSLPTAKSYRYVKSKDEIVESTQSAKERRDRYTTMIHHVVLRTVHEMLESDRANHIDTVSLTASVHHRDPATGRPVTTDLVGLAVDRETFLSIDLGEATPSATLKHLRASLSKDPHAMVAATGVGGVRG